jgi:hypothetical protein
MVRVRRCSRRSRRGRGRRVSSTSWTGGSCGARRRCDAGARTRRCRSGPAAPRSSASSGSTAAAALPRSCRSPRPSSSAPSMPNCRTAAGASTHRRTSSSRPRTTCPRRRPPRPRWRSGRRWIGSGWTRGSRPRDGLTRARRTCTCCSGSLRRRGSRSRTSTGRPPASGWRRATAAGRGCSAWRRIPRRAGAGWRGRCCTRSRSGREQGAPCIYLQVECDNAPAAALYASMGFSRSHGYHFRVAP